MVHWAEHYVGRPYKDGSADCATLVREVLCDRLDIDVGPTPDGSAWRRLSTKDIEVAHGSIFIRVAKPMECDVALLRMNGDRRTLGSHVGVVVNIGGRQRLLHALKRVGSAITPIVDLPALMLEVTGYYRLNME